MAYTNIPDAISRIPQYGGKIYYVATDGDAGNDGLSPKNPLVTIGAAIALAVSGDAISVKAGTYTEINLDLGSADTKHYLELWCERGTLIDPASGTALTISGNSCAVRGFLKVTPDSAATGVIVSGDECKLDHVKVVDGSDCYQITGTGTILDNCLAGFPDTGTYGFNITGGQTGLYNCSTVGDTATYGYHINNGADTGILENCTSTGHETSGFYVDTGSKDWIISNCSSGGGDGSRVDVDEANVWSDFHYVSRLHKNITLTADGTTVSYNLFKVTGTVKISLITGVVTSNLSGENTNCYLDVYSTNGSEKCSKVTDCNLGALIAGSVIMRLDKKDKVLIFQSATGPGIIDSVDVKEEGFRILEDRTGAAHVATYLRFTHTSASASGGTMHFDVLYENVTDDGFLAVVA